MAMARPHEIARYVSYFLAVCSFVGVCVLMGLFSSYMRMQQIFQVNTPVSYLFRAAGQPSVTAKKWSELGGYTKPYREKTEETIWLYHYLWFCIYVIPDEDEQYVAFVYWGRT